MEMTKLR
jgi:hypothetical protein